MTKIILRRWGTTANDYDIIQTDDPETIETIDRWIATIQPRLPEDDQVGNVIPGLEIYRTSDGNIEAEDTIETMVYSDVDRSGTVAIPQDEIDAFFESLEAGGVAVP